MLKVFGAFLCMVGALVLSMNYKNLWAILGVAFVFVGILTLMLPDMRSIPW